ncbi:MAG: hypothetical protein HQL65_19895 [Magnetococcales bacterium]|nr:hypothetical protein [Magnetococcales bacterium]
MGLVRGRSTNPSDVNWEDVAGALSRLKPLEMLLLRVIVAGQEQFKRDLCYYVAAEIKDVAESEGWQEILSYKQKILSETVINEIINQRICVKCNGDDSDCRSCHGRGFFPLLSRESMSEKLEIPLSVWDRRLKKEYTKIIKYFRKKMVNSCIKIKVALGF